MTEPVQPELLEKLFSDGLSPEQEKSALESCFKSKPATAPALLSILLQQKHHYRAMLEESKQANEQLLKTLQDPPWHPAAFVSLSSEGQRALVASGSRRISVALGPHVDRGALRRGSMVFLNGSQNVLIDVAPDLQRPGAVAELSRFHGPDRGVLRGHGDEEVVVDLAADLLEAGVKGGELLLYDRDNFIAYEKVETRHQQTGLLEELLPDMRIEDLGGLDNVFEELVQEVTLHLFHPELVQRYHLKPVKGVLLCGPPGTGKTSLVQALGEHLVRVMGVDVKVFLVRPGIHRSMWYGSSEQRVRDLFREAKKAAENSCVFLFFDDMDHLGSRDHRAAGEVDARLLPCFLQEIDAVRSSRLMLFGATNREDLLDEAMLRPGRFGKVLRIGRPNRRQAREIFSRHFTPDLPVHENGRHGQEAAQDLIERALAAVYAPNGEFSTLATLTFRDGSRRPLTAAQVMSGALIADAVEQAKRRGCFRELNGEESEITSDDLAAAIARELSSIAERLRPGPALHQMLGLPQDLDVVRVEVCRTAKSPRSSEYLMEPPS